MRPPFRSVSFPCLRQWGACCPPRVAKTLQRDCTSLRPSCWPLDLVGKCSLAPLARPWLGRLPSVASLRLPLAPLVLGSGFACLGFAPPDRLPGVRPPLAVPLAPLVRFSVSLRKGKRYFREKRAFRGTHIFPENGMFGFFSVSTPKKHESKQILYITSL